MEANYFTILYWFCHTSTWICHRCTRVPNPELPPPISLPYHPSGSSQCTSPEHPVLCIEPGLAFFSYMILYMFQYHSPKSSQPLPLPQSPKDCSIHLCLFCCVAYRVILTIFLESDSTERLHFHFSLSCIGEGNGNPLQCSCLENPRDGGAWRAAIHGVAQSQTWLKRFSSSSILYWCFSFWLTSLFTRLQFHPPH